MERPLAGAHLTWRERMTEKQGRNRRTLVVGERTVTAEVLSLMTAPLRYHDTVFLRVVSSEGH
jgi:hypothetical protein